jgi:hypothetical protein
VVRYPHTATVKVVETTVSEGEYSSESETDHTIKGRLELTEPRRVKTPTGDYTDLKGTFFTKSEIISGAKTITVDSEEFNIIRWIQYQTNSEIWLD